MELNGHWQDERPSFGTINLDIRYQPPFPPRIHHLSEASAWKTSNLKSYFEVWRFILRFHFKKHHLHFHILRNNEISPNLQFNMRFKFFGFFCNRPHHLELQQLQNLPSFTKTKRWNCTARPAWTGVRVQKTVCVWNSKQTANMKTNGIINMQH